MFKIVKTCEKYIKSANIYKKILQEDGRKSGKNVVQKICGRAHSLLRYGGVNIFRSHPPSFI
jgi:hypothetical protein